MGLDPRVCPHCGAREDTFSLVSEEPALLACGSCGACRAFRRLPLLCLTGPSGTGKSTVGAMVAPVLADEVVTLEQDVLWSPELADGAGGVRHFRATWLRLAAMVAQSGRPVLLCGTVHPAELEELPERVLFGAVEHLALMCEPSVLAARLRARPAWRGWDEGRIAEMLDYADRLRVEAAGLGLTLVDTTDAAPHETASLVAAWARERLAARR